ncbi:MAG: hypothetical protein MJK12_18095 [Colwellia sp.]|nr:hypothetical protein [Colwellia sp.]
MEELNKFKNESYLRVALSIGLLAVWFIAFSYATTFLSPLDDLIKSSPIKSTANIDKKMSRVEAQARITREVSNNYYELSLSYSEDTKKLKDELLKYRSKKNSFDSLMNYLSRIDHLSNKRRNFFGTSTSLVPDKLDSSKLIPREISLTLLVPTVSIVSHQESKDVPTIEEYFFIQSNEEVKQKGIKVNNDNFKSQNLFSILKISDYTIAERYARNGTHLDLSTVASLLQPLIDGYKLTDLASRYSIPFNAFSEESMNEKIDLIIDTLNDIQNELHANYLKYNKIATELETSYTEIGARLLSSTPLFAVVAFRSSIVIFLFVSIGAILIKGLAAELNQSRRITYSSVSMHLLSKIDDEKLSNTADIIYAVAGDKVAPSTSDNTPNNISSSIEKLEKAIEKNTKEMASKIRS